MTGSAKITSRIALGLLGLVLFGSVAFGVSRQPAQPSPEVESPPLEIAASNAIFEHAAPTDDGRIQVFVELRDPPAAVTYAMAMRGFRPSDKQALAKAGAASKAQVAKVKAAQEIVAQSLFAAPIDAREIYRISKALNGIAIAVDRANLGQLFAIPGIKRVLPIILEHTTSLTSVPFIGAPNVWANTIGLPAGVLGAGVRVGIIDTGIDYLHGDFGGSGTLTSYQTESTASAAFTTAGSFPTAKVVGGTDFAGDAYTGSNSPVPDANPMDCNGHGSHVAGTAAGFGVTAAGATFAGPYDANLSTYSSLRIAPGVAPQASLYALRVFGCGGSTALVPQAIDWAMDPNNDDDLSDHLDVINMSLGSDFGISVDASSEAAENAAHAGVIVAISAGNSSDTFFIVGSPGVTGGAITTAASLDSGEQFLGVQVNTPAAIAGPYAAGAASFGPPVSPSFTAHAVVLAQDPADASGPLTTDGCSALTNAAAVAGNIALIDRGTCGFTVKTKNAQNAGAVGVIIVNNAPGSTPPGLGGADATITIPAVSVTLVDGNTLKANLTNLNATLLGLPGGDTLASFSSRGPAHRFEVPLAVKPDVAAPGLNVTSVQTGHTCTSAGQSCTGAIDPSGFTPNNQALVISGTSMASPHVAGTMALLRQLHPDWSVEELKALAMNYAVHDVTVAPNSPPRFGPSRVGAGRIDPAAAAVGSVIAMNAEDSGLVSVTFQPEVVGASTQTKMVRLVNFGLTPQTFDLAIDTIVDSPGVAFSLPSGSSVTIPAASSVTLPVQMSATSSLMQHVRDPTMAATQGVQANYGDQPRNFLTEEGAYLTFSQSSALKLRLPIYMAEKPSSAMAGPSTIATGGNPTGSTSLALSGTDLCTGTLTAGPACSGIGNLPTVESLVTPFELEVVAPFKPTVPNFANIHYVGTSYAQASSAGPSITNDLILFGVASWGDWSTPNDVSYDICVDTNNDGVYEKVVLNTVPSIFVASAPRNDNFVRIVDDTATNGNSILGLGSLVNLLSPASFDTALHLSNVMVLGVTPSQLGIASTAVTTIKFKVVTCSGFNPECARTATTDRCSPTAGTFFDQASGPYVYNWAAQGLNFGGDFFDDDLNGSSLGVSWNTANMAANGSAGALLLHHFNGVGQRAQVVLLDSAPRVDLALTNTVSSATPDDDTNVTFTLTVVNNGPNNATGVVVSDPLLSGLTWVSDDGAGAYTPGTGVWLVGSLANGASATLHITAEVTSTAQIQNVAQIVGSSPLDPNPANDRAVASLEAPGSADLHLTFGANVTSVNVGGSIIYTLTVTNNGSDPAYSVNVAEAFPLFPSLAPGSFTVSQGVFVPGTGIWNLASLLTGQTATLSFTVTAPNFAGNLVNNASTSSQAGGSQVVFSVDPNPSDNSQSVSVLVLSPATITASKTVAGTFVNGGAVTYTIVISNSSAFDQQDNPGHELTDVLPSQLTLVSATATAGTAVATVATRTVTWDGGVPAHGSVTVTIHATVNPGTAPSTVSNQASLSFDADGNGTNESSAQSAAPGGGPTTFAAASPAAIGTHSKTVVGNFTEGGQVTYTVTISNSGSSPQLDNPGDEFTDVLPAALTLVSANANSGAAVADIPTNTVHWNGSIAVGGSVTITIIATIGDGVQGQTISNQGTIFFDADGNGTNESSIQTDDPNTAATDDATSFQVASLAQVPTLSTWGLALLVLLLSFGALLALRRRRA
jgi:uncharacterized repeat protein (TIGR01451 family)